MFKEWKDYKNEQLNEAHPAAFENPYAYAAQEGIDQINKLLDRHHGMVHSTIKAAAKAGESWIKDKPREIGVAPTGVSKKKPSWVRNIEKQADQGDEPSKRKHPKPFPEEEEKPSLKLPKRNRPDSLTAWHETPGDVMMEASATSPGGVGLKDHMMWLKGQIGDIVQKVAADVQEAVERESSADPMQGGTYDMQSWKQSEKLPTKKSLAARPQTGNIHDRPKGTRGFTKKQIKPTDPMEKPPSDPGFIARMRRHMNRR